MLSILPHDKGYKVPPFRFIQLVNILANLHELNCQNLTVIHQLKLSSFNYNFLKLIINILYLFVYFRPTCFIWISLYCAEYFLTFKWNLIYRKQFQAIILTTKYVWLQFYFLPAKKLLYLFNESKKFILTFSLCLLNINNILWHITS